MQAQRTLQASPVRGFIVAIALVAAVLVASVVGYLAGRPATTAPASAPAAAATTQQHVLGPDAQDRNDAIVRASQLPGPDAQARDELIRSQLSQDGN